jgi:hypothetical protein
MLWHVQEYRRIDREREVSWIERKISEKEDDSNREIIGNRLGAACLFVTALAGHNRAVPIFRFVAVVRFADSFLLLRFIYNFAGQFSR